MFYQCKNCKINWQYPVEKCPECFSKIERSPSKKIKVISVSQVWITTPLHPKVPYFVLLLEDEQGRKWVQKSIKEYKVDQEFKLEKAAGDKNAVSIWRVKYDILEGIEKAFDLLEFKINSGSKILIAPTLITPAHPYFAKNTSPQVLNQLIGFLLREGVKKDNIKIAAQSFDDIPIAASAHKSKVFAVCEKNGVEFIDLAQKGFKRVKKGDFTFDISETLFQNNLVINLPIMKLDKKIKVRGALANLTSLLKKGSFLGLKYLYGEEKLMMGLNEVLPEILSIADTVSIQTSKNNFTTFVGLILASFNPLNLDRVFAEIAMSDLSEYLKSVNLKEIKTVGREIGEVQYDLEFMI